MKKRLLYIVMCFFINYTSALFAQIDNAIISYKGVINEQYVESFLSKLQEKDIPLHTKQSVAKMYKNATPDFYFLNIENNESYYYHDKVLESDLLAEEYNVGSKAGTNAFYTNNKDNLIIEYSNALGNIKYGHLDWKLTQESKIILGFTCYKATSTEKLYSRQGHFYYRDVEAWFAPEIPLNFGPKYYKGLPGLILEVNSDRFTITATEINLNPEEKDLKIKDLGNKEFISQEESFRRIEEFMNERQKAQ